MSGTFVSVLRIFNPHVYGVNIIIFLVNIILIPPL